AARRDLVRHACRHRIAGAVPDLVVEDADVRPPRRGDERVEPGAGGRIRSRRVSDAGPRRPQPATRAAQRAAGSGWVHAPLRGVAVNVTGFLSAAIAAFEPSKNWSVLSVQVPRFGAVSSGAMKRSTAPPNLNACLLRVYA